MGIGTGMVHLGRNSIKLELTKHFTLHANGQPLLKRSSPHSLLSSSATILLVWSANGDAPFQGKFQSQFTKRRYLPMELCDVILRKRVRCALNMEILDLLNKDNVSGARSGRASL